MAMANASRRRGPRPGYQPNACSRHGHCHARLVPATLINHSTSSFKGAPDRQARHVCACCARVRCAHRQSR